MLILTRSKNIKTVSYDIIRKYYETFQLGVRLNLWFLDKIKGKVQSCEAVEEFHIVFNKLQDFLFELVP
jgi:hypothetical protein